MTNAPTETMLESREDEVLSHSLEDYLEAIVDLAGPERKPIRAVDLANKLDVSKASVSKALTSLNSRTTATSRSPKRARNTARTSGASITSSISS